MKQLGLAVATVFFAASFVACPLLKKKSADDDTTTAGPPDAATVAVSGTGAKNEAAVLRYANETPLSNEGGVIGKDGTIARNFPGNGPTVAVLAKGTAVAKIAQYFSTGTLVMFDDPVAADGTKLLGWVTPTSFDLAAPPPAKPFVLPPQPKRDAGAAPTVVDAGGGGGTAPVDGGGGGGGGGGLPQPRPGQVSVQPVGGKCPDGWAISQLMCRKKCADDKECFRGTTCAAKGGPKVCSSDH